MSQRCLSKYVEADSSDDFGETFDVDEIHHQVERLTMNPSARQLSGIVLSNGSSPFIEHVAHCVEPISTGVPARRVSVPVVDVRPTTEERNSHSEKVASIFANHSAGCEPTIPQSRRVGSRGSRVCSKPTMSPISERSGLSGLESPMVSFEVRHERNQEKENIPPPTHQKGLSPSKENDRSKDLQSKPFSHNSESTFCLHPWLPVEQNKPGQTPTGGSNAELSGVLKTPKKPKKLSEISTPRHQRSTSVKVSLTPAQRYEKQPGMSSYNALKDFEFTTMVGRGAFASVYKGRNLMTNQIVAIKRIVLAEHEGSVTDLMGEIDLLKILKHENIVKYHGFVKTSDSLNIFLEFCDGGSLRQLYKKIDHGLDERHQIIPFVHSILQGLDYLHSQGVVHRDVKAANVLVDEHGVIKLADFGVAAKVSSQYQTVVGTPNWMAPETVLGGEGLCTASDIWALGATIIELFTTHPPYHDRNPMATLHAISTDEHPPLPKGISSLARDFLLECFQKQPSLRSNARQLLKHKWLANSGAVKKQSDSLVPAMKKSPVPLPQYAESQDENWDRDFGDIPKQILPRVRSMPTPSGPSEPPTPKEKNAFKFGGEVVRLKPPSERIKAVSETPFKTPEMQSPFLSSQTIPPRKSPGSSSPTGDSEGLKERLLQQYVEDDEAPSTRFLSGVDFDQSLLPATSVGPHTLPNDEDPFLALDFEVFDSGDLEVQLKMEFLMSKFAGRVDALKNHVDDSTFDTLVKISGRISHVVRKYPVSHGSLFREHGLITFLELLESAPNLPRASKVWYHTMVTLNHLFAANVNAFESFCLLGGIPMVFQLRSPSYDNRVRTQVVKFIRLFITLDSPSALSTLISSGGLRVVSKFVEDDFDQYPLHPVVSVDCIATILERRLVRSNSDLCRILSKYGLVFWVAVLLNRITTGSHQYGRSVSSADVDVCLSQCLSIFTCFAQSEAKVRVTIANPELFKLIFKAFPCLEVPNQLVILKFIKSMSCITEVLPILYRSEVIEFLYRLLESFKVSNPHYNEIMNSICPILYNCLYLNHNRETELVRLGGAPYLFQLATSKLPMREFILPIVCELVYCDEGVRDALLQQNCLKVYWKMVLDPYWQNNALESLIHWAATTSPAEIFESSEALGALEQGFLMHKVSNVEATMDSFYRLLVSNSRIVQALFKAVTIHSILNKLMAFKDTVIRLSLLRILKILVKYGCDNDHLTIDELKPDILMVLRQIETIQPPSLLVRNLVSGVNSLLSVA
ncbi:hypothetical protein DICA1_B01772 [Diutina catenulata]